LNDPVYIRLTEGGPFPALSELSPFRAIVIAEETTSPKWRMSAAHWLVDQGCLYMMAWGCDCSLWDDDVDEANGETFNWGEIPDNKFVMTTWHEDEALDEVLWFAKFAANHPNVEISNVLILHICKTDRGEYFSKRFMTIE
jgi:hypothetical protein